VEIRLFAVSALLLSPEGRKAAPYKANTRFTIDGIFDTVSPPTYNISLHWLVSSRPSAGRLKTDVAINLL
jgi:hypothetical protein